jgi:SH3-like domain-containing protein
MSGGMRPTLQLTCLMCGTVLLGCPQKPTAPTPVTVTAVADAGASWPGVVAWSRVSMRVAADEKARAAALVNYGERLTVLEKSDTFCRVRLSDGQEGFLPTRFIIVGAAQEATLTADQDLYARPEALSPVKKREKPGVLLFVLQDNNGWRQVQLPDRTQGWIPRDRAVTDAAEVAGAVAILRGDTLATEGKAAEAAAVYQDHLQQHAGTRLGPLVAARLAKVRPDAGVPGLALLDAGVVPVAAATVDAGAPAAAPPSPRDGGAP